MTGQRGAIKASRAYGLDAAGITHTVTTMLTRPATT